MRQILVNITKYLGFSKKEIKAMNFDLIESITNDYFTQAHKAYLRSVKKHLMDYDFFYEMLLVRINKRNKDNPHSDEFHHEFATKIVMHSLDKKKETVREFFESQPMGNYADLLRKALGSKYTSGLSSDDVALSTQSVVKDHASFTKIKAKKGMEAEGSESLMMIPMTEAEIKEVTSFANDMGLFSGNVSANDMEGFLNCEKDSRLHSRNNNLTALLFCQLAKQAILKTRWASIIANNRMLVGSTGKIITNRRNLSAPANKICNKLDHALNNEESLIIKFAEALASKRVKAAV